MEVLIEPPPAEWNDNRRLRSEFFLRAAWGLLTLACQLIERAEEYRARAHAIDVKAYDEARRALDQELVARTQELKIELAIREMIEARDEAGAADEYGVRW